MHIYSAKSITEFPVKKEIYKLQHHWQSLPSCNREPEVVVQFAVLSHLTPLYT